MRQQLYRRLHQAYASGALRLVKRIHALLAIADGMTVCEVAQMLTWASKQSGTTATVSSGKALPVWSTSVLQGDQQTDQNATPGTEALIEAGPQAAGYPSGCWSATILQDLIHRHLGWSTIPIISVPCWITWAFHIRKPALSLPISMRRPAWRGARHVAQGAPEGPPAQSLVTVR